MNKIYSKFSNNSVRNDNSYFETNFNERHNPRNIALEYQARTARRFILPQDLFFPYRRGRINIFYDRRHSFYDRRHNLPAEFLPILLPDFVEEEIEIPEDAICGITFEKPNCHIPCSHFFCRVAITTWLKQQQNEGRNMTCPSCRDIITKISLAQKN